MSVCHTYCCFWNTTAPLDTPIKVGDVFMFAAMMYALGGIDVCFTITPYFSSSSFQCKTYFEEQNVSGACQRTLSGQRPTLPSVLGNTTHVKLFRELIARCWADDATRRPSFEALARELDDIIRVVP